MSAITALDALARRADLLMRTHHGRSGKCVACGQPAPCDTAILADHNRELASVAPPVKRCDNRSVGVIISDGEGRYLVFDRATYPSGSAGCAGHVDDHGTEYDAARAEVYEETGLDVPVLAPLVRCWRDNPCRRPSGSREQGHGWAVYTTTAHGTLRPSQRETRNIRWLTHRELQTRYARTLALAKDSVSWTAFDADPGLEPVWARWFSLAGAVQTTNAELALIETLFDRYPRAAAEG